MSISSNTAQTRELSELRNHLKWLDEERRKSGRKMAELEQRLAQQGRELADRDQKIQELEWHVANFAERFERLPDLDTNVAGTEQRLQDLEWHLSNMNTQLTRMPNMEEERARLLEETTRIMAASQERQEAGLSLLESRLRAEMVTLRESDEHRALSIRQDEQSQTLHGLEQQIVAVQESVGMLSGQLRERTVNLAAESQANISALAARLQEHLEAMAAEQESTLNAWFAEQQATLNVMSAEQQSGLSAMAAEQQARLDALAAEWQTRLDHLPLPSNDPSPELLLHGEQIAELGHAQQQWQLRLAQLEAELAERQQNAQLRLSQLETELAEKQQQSQARLAELEQGVQSEQIQLGRQVQELRDALTAVTSRHTDIVGLMERLPSLEGGLAAQEEQLAAVERMQQQWQSQLAQSEQAYQAMLDERLPAVETEMSALREASAALASRLTQQQATLGSLEESIAKLGHIREIMPILDRLEQEMELRQAEEVRLSNLIGTQESRFAPLAGTLEDVSETTSALLSRVSDSERLLEELRASIQDFNDNWKPALSETSRRITPLTERITVLSNNIMKAEAGLQALTGDQSELREMMVGLNDDVRRNQSDVVRQLEGWQATLDENKDTIERFTQQWITLSNQYKEARMAVQNFAHWQKQLEQQKREASEMLRIESNRMQSRWDGFLLEIQEKLKNFELELGQKWQAFELENEQKWSSARRNEQIRREELAAVDELIQKLQQDNRNLIWRVQAAQADAIKKWPRLLMEEVEKAVELNPNRRLTSTGAAPRADMSVVDAIEQGLITIDYNDDSALDI